VKRKITVTFETLGLKVKTDAGKTIFKIARENCVAIRSECGGRKICGKFPDGSWRVKDRENL